MIDFNTFKNVSTVKKAIRETAFSDMVEFFSERYGTDNVSIVGNNEIAVCIGLRTLADGTDGEICFTVKPVAKDFDIRVAESGKVFQPYERIKESDAYEIEKTKKEREAEEKAKLKAEKKERDKKAREKAKTEKENQ